MSLSADYCKEGSECRDVDVVIVGNGPSAICLSLLLSGYRPYYNGKPHPNSFLEHKLQNLGENESIIEQDLSYLSEGLEGRSSNPVALLFDSLMRPDADLGADNPSVLEWKYEKEHAISHVVLGKGRPGGAWQRMDAGSMQTLSLGNWMELPTLPFRDWLDQQFRKENVTGTCNNRATISDVRNYYTDFVKQRHLESNFYDHHAVTSVQKVFKINNNIDMESGEILPCCKNVKNHPFHWEVRGHKVRGDIHDDVAVVKKSEEFCFRAPHVVIATGTFDIPNRLSVPGETLPHVFHSLHEFENCLNSNNMSSNENEPILIVGAGLSAADAILMALRAERQVIHVFRSGANDSSLIFKKLPAGIYPEYHHVHSLMKGKDCNLLYRPYAKHQIEELKDDKVLLQRIGSDDITSISVSCVVILIGSRPNLSFLQQDGKNLGVVPRHPIDSKHNPVDTDLHTYQSNQVQGLFALGPLVGDNFVRFGIAGALGVTNYLLRKRLKIL